MTLTKNLWKKVENIDTERPNTYNLVKITDIRQKI